MAIIINNYPVNADEATFNTNPLSQIKYNGTVVWESASYADPFWIKPVANDGLKFIGTSIQYNKYLSYSYDKEVWNNFNLQDTTSTPIPVYANQKLYLRHNNTNNNGIYPLVFKMVNNTIYDIGGHITSLFLGGVCPDYGLMEAFYNSTVRYADELIMPTMFNGAHNCHTMFVGSGELLTAPSLPAEWLTEYCYAGMFRSCPNLNTIPALPATTLPNNCYNGMFQACTSIKVSTSNIDPYLNAYRIPDTGTGTVGTNSLSNMFKDTGGTFTGTAQINTTYYTSNSIKR